MSTTTLKEMLELMRNAQREPCPIALHMSPAYFDTLKGVLPPSLPIASNLDGLPVFINEHVSSWALEYSDGSWKLPPGERAPLAS